MVANIIVAVICDLIAALVLVSGIFTAKSNGLKVTLVKLFGAAGGLVGAYFVTPVFSNLLYSVEKVPELFAQIGISNGSINSCIFMLFFMIVYGFTLIVCSIVRHVLIKKLQNKKVNKAKLKRAKSINPRAEKAVKNAEWKAAKGLYKEKRKWYTQLIACFLGVVIAVATGVVVLMPFGYIGKDIHKATDKSYLVDGFNYTLNGVIPDEVFDWAVSFDASADSDKDCEEDNAQDESNEENSSESVE